jgi:hypothetical protein
MRDREWYHSARTQVRQHESLYDLEPPSGLDATVPEPTQDTQEDGSDAGEGPRREQRTPSVSTTAIKELHIHELAALASCFIFPLIGTWVLHTIRAKLSRPSEGLVSNYNLTIFLLAAEIRPFKHLLRMVQTRTLHLQRVIASSEDDDRDRIDASEVHDLSKRLEELEAHVAETAASRLASNKNHNHNNNNGNNGNSNTDEPRELTPQEQEYTLSLVSQAAAEYRKGFQTDIDALNRAVRRYEKRTAVSAYQTESRLQLLEAKARDALSIAAAAQRSSAQQPKSIIAIILDWISTAVLFPVHIGISLASLPLLLAKRGALVCKDIVLGKTPTKKSPGNAGGGGGSGRTSKGKAPQSRKSVLSQQRRAKRATIIEE